MKYSDQLKKALLLLMIPFFVGITNVYSQDDQFDAILEAGIEDAEKFTQNYLEPFVKGFGYSINNGWFHTAKPHKTLGFDLILTVNAAMIPDKEAFFTFKNNDYNNIFIAGSDKETPTVFGPAEPGPELTIIDDNGEEVIRISSPQGVGLKDEIGYNLVPTPMLQLGLGIAKGTDVKIRYSPTITYENAEFDLIGFGVMHDIKQWIPGLKEAPLELSVMGGYTRLSTKYLLDADNAPDQEGNYSTTGMTFQGIISKKLSVFTFYGAMGFNTVRTDIDVLGTYEINDETTLVDPLQLSYSHSSPRMTFGLNMKLGPVLLYGDYTINEYPLLTVGFGFSVR